MLRASAEGIENFSVFCNHVTIIPAIKAILDSPDLRLDGFIGPGHVSTVIGCRPYEFIARDYGKPLVMAGFEPLDILQSVYMLMLQLAEGRCEVENQYARVVPWDGNPVALRAIGESMELRPYFEWRGLGFISHSALQVRDAYAALRRRAALRRARGAGRRPEGVPVRRGAQGRAQAVGVQGVRHRVHAGDADRHLHGLAPRAPARRTTTSAGSPRAVEPRRPDDRALAQARPRRDREQPRAAGRADGRSCDAPISSREHRCSTASSGPAARPGCARSASPWRTAPAARPRQTLIEAVFLEAFRNPLLEPLEDAAVADGRRRAGSPSPPTRYVVSPLFFPGGDIGDLAVNGTVNDLAVSGARAAVPVGRLHPRGGLPGRRPAPDRRLDGARPRRRPGCRSSPATPRSCERGKADGCYINTAGVGSLERDRHARRRRSAQPGDAVLVSGPIGDHGITIMLARGELDIEADLVSDTAPLHGLVAGLLDAVRRRARACGTRPAAGWRRSSTRSPRPPSRRGGRRGRVPVRAEVRGACELLGIDPLYVACEGRMVVVVDGDAGRRRAGRAARPSARRRGGASSARSRPTRRGWSC